MFPWAQALSQTLQQRAQQQQLPHAMLLTGPQGVGKLGFIMAFTQGLLCEQPDTMFSPCGKCRSCAQFLSNNHPDFILITPEEDSSRIKIDQIRQLREDLSLTRHYQSGYRIVVINPADAMNAAAANSLLKTLEEPPAQTLLFLLSHQPSLLSATIRSRCQRLTLALPSHKQAISWLASQNSATSEVLENALSAAHGAPLAALDWLKQNRVTPYAQVFQAFCAVAEGTQSASEVAASWLKTEHGVPIHWLYRWAAMLIQLKCGQTLETGDAKQRGILQNLAQRVDLQDLFDLLNRMTESLRLEHTTVNQQLMYESLLLHWASITAKQGHARKGAR